MASLVTKRAGRLAIPEVIFFVCDIQERFRDIIFKMPQVISTGKTMIDSAAVLGIPVIITEQYPKVFGNTVSEFGAQSPAEGAEGAEVNVFAKRKFSMMTSEVASYFEAHRAAGRCKAILFGIEAHVCLQQTCLDLLHEGVEVHILVDGVSSQRNIDRKTAIARMQQAGALITTSESALFELLGDSTHEKFKAISSLVKLRPPESAWQGLEM